MQIFVRGPGNATSVIDMLPTETVLTLKQLLWARLRVPVESMWMESNGRILQDHQTLVAAGVGLESTVWCHIRAGGGRCHVCENLYRE